MARGSGGDEATDLDPAALAIDTSVAHVARVYNYWLGGKDNFAADRAAGEAAIRAFPNIGLSARSNRALLARAVRFLAGQAGIRQFLDIGTGIPSADNTHQVAQSVALPPGSYLTISHPAADIDAEAMAKMAASLDQTMAEKVTFRDHDAVARFFDGLELVEPGLVQASNWRPATQEDADRPAALWAGVALKK